ncbi:hypothetical protein GORDON_23 [Arthrobacter phage Gordon]|uniref:Minor tail protein n=1 Tax=Arthrobacter phage Gordon TaxID=1772298 RepID=A0A0U4IDW6_9CAUD|nr:minor tail protein [Arthrobacter phage Gordon]ALY08998.1 hypothetical protein GORDON_23 [Arthrobacter phage Gordon]
MAQTPDDPTKAQVWITKGIDDLDFEFYFPQGPKGDPGPFVPISVTGSSGTNLNDLTAPGVYSVAIPTLANDSALQNYPMHEAGSMWITTSNAGSVVVQQYTTNTKGMYVRRRFSGTWSAWRFFGQSRTDQTAGRTMYQWDEINQREQLVYGDTGVRSIPMDNNYLGTLQIRRLGNQVYLNGAIKRPVGGSINGTFLISIPDGFKPQAVAWTFFPVRHSPTPNWGTLYRKAYELVLEGLTGDTDAGEARFEISWSTVQAWPTVLPGTASGSIPNT